MIKIIKAPLFTIFNKITSNNGSLISRTPVIVTYLQNKTVNNFSLDRKYCSRNCDEGSSDSEKNFYNVNFEEITNGNPEMTKKLEKLKLEIESLRLQGSLIPKKMKISEWKYLLSKSSIHAKIKYLTFLAKNEFKEEGKKKKKQKEIADYEEKKKLLNVTDHIDYGIGHNALFLKFLDRSIAQLQYTRCCTAMLYSNDIVFDFGYEKYMSDFEIKQCAKQIMATVVLNRDHINPFNIHFCNFPTEGRIHDFFRPMFEIYKTFHSVHIHEESYLEVFNRKNLVYLSPHAKDILQDYNPDDVYIIGSFVDKGDSSLAVSFGKAKAEKLRSAKLPLDLYLDWKHGNKSLPLNIVLGIMLDLNYYGDMKKALCNHVPTRFYYRSDEEKKLHFGT